jgi:ssDNA-binding Zn-finger/Zn-ribbon topoisomerase 1
VRLLAILKKGDFKMIRDNKFYPYGGYEEYPLADEKCPKCGSPLYIHDGGDQGGIPHIECTNDCCQYQRY